MSLPLPRSLTLVAGALLLSLSVRATAMDADAGPELDAGVSVLDAGVSWLDAGFPVLDAGPFVIVNAALPGPSNSEVGDGGLPLPLAAAAAPPGTTPDDTSVQGVIEEESEDLQNMKAAEQAVIDPGAPIASRLFNGSGRLGRGSALSCALQDALSPDRAYEPLLPELAGQAAIDPRVAAVFDIAKAKGEYDIPVEMRSEVAQWIGFFQHSGRKYFVHYLARSSRYLPVMQDILRQEGLPEDTVFLSMIESGFSTMAYSWAKASGPWQFIDATGKRFGLKVDFWIDERRDPVKSTRAAARYLRELHDEFGDWYLAWAGYNAGAGKIRKAVNKYGTKNFWDLCDAGRFLRAETKNYVPKLIAAALVTKHAEAFGFSRAEIAWEKPLESEEVRVSDPTDVAIVAKAAECTVEDLKILNPELRRWLTPPGKVGDPYVVKVPKGHRAAFEANFPKVAPKERLAFKIYSVKRGDTLSKIALANHSFPEAIMRMNGLTSSKRLRLGTELMIPVASESAWKEAARATPPEKPRVAKPARAGLAMVAPEEEIPAGTPNAPVATGPLKHGMVNGKDQVIYGIQSGDNLWSVGQRFGVTVEELKGWNDLTGKRPKLKIGQELTIYPRQLPAATPAPAVASAATPAAAAPTPAVEPKPAVAPPPVVEGPPDQVTTQGGHKHIVHTLVTGDTLWTLSQRYKVSVDSLKKSNHLRKKAVLHPGSTLVVDVAEGG